MRRIARTIVFGLALAVAATSLVSIEPAWADPPGGFKHKGKGQSGDRGRDRDDDRGTSVTINFNFRDHDRVAIRDYFGGYVQSGRCPPGLAKKHNGCMPPGQAKKWAIGRPLPRDVIYYALPPDLVVMIAAPPSGYRYVRVGADVLMIAVGTGMVAAAIEDLARL